MTARIPRFLRFLALLAFAACSPTEEEATTATPEEVSPSAAQDPQPNGPSVLPVDEVLEWPTQVRVPRDVEPRFERVVLVTIDTLRKDHVSSYGYPRATTPFLDSLARKGALFDHAVSSSSHTAPSHATMLTGLHPLEHGVLENGAKLDPELIDLARVFKRAGFRTAAFLNVRFLEAISSSFHHVEAKVLRAPPVVDATLEWLEAERLKRFFLWVHLYEPHHWKKNRPPVHQTLPDVEESTTLDDDALFAHLEELHGLTPGAEEGTWILGPSNDDGGGDIELVTREDFLAHVDRYDALIRQADKQVRRLYRAIDDEELGGSTLWVVTSDHGEGIGSHEFSGHGGRIYQEQLNVPLWIHASDGSIAQRRVPELVQHVDLLPTLAEVVQGEPVGFDPAKGGVSLWPLLTGEGSWRERPAFSQRRPSASGREEDLFALQTSTTKYIFHSGEEDELYDLGSDPGERSNVIGSGHPDEERLLELMKRRLRWYGERRAAANEVELSEEYEDELRALGYAE